MDEDLNIAASKIQNAYRGRRNYRILRKKLKDNIVKLPDKDKGGFVYRNKRTGVVSTVKPLWLGKDDIEAAKQYVAPIGYDPGTCDDDGYALVITVNSFLSDKLTGIGHGTDSDHEAIEKLLSHNFICKLKADNIIELKDPSCDVFVSAMERLRKMCTKTSFLFVYISTHIVTIKGGDYRGIGRKRENTYFCMRDTDWSSTPEAKASAVSMTKFIKLLQSIACERKTVALHYAHSPAPPISTFKTRILYPPSDFLIRLAKLGKCVVIGSCNIGTPVSVLVKHTYDPVKAVMEATQGKKRRRTIAKGKPAKANGNLTQSTSTAAVAKTPAPEQTAGKLGTVHKKNERKNSEVVSADVDTKQQTFTDRERQFELDTTQEFYKDWGVEEPPPLSFAKSACPEPPQPSWTMDKVNGMKVEAPSGRATFRYRLKVFGWAVRRTVGPPANLLRRVAHSLLARPAVVSPKQHCYSSKTASRFGSALQAALRGGASNPENPYVTAQAVFECIKTHLLAKTAEDGLRQCPVMVLPPKCHRFAGNPVCFRCGPPGAPNRPYAVSVGNDRVELAWTNQKFEGVPPARYRILMRYSQSRNFADWTPIPYPSDLTKRTFTVRSLPSGVQVQFKVQGFNSGGWGKPSQASEPLCPGEKLMPIDDKVKWHRLNTGGPLAIVARLDSFPLHRHEYVTGLRLLVSLAQKSNGFQRENVQIKVAKVAIHSLETFFADPDLCATAVLLLGYSLRGPNYDLVKTFLEEEDIADKMRGLVDAFRNESKVIGAVTWLRAVMEEIDPIPALVIVEPPKKRRTPEEDELEEGDGAAGDEGDDSTVKTDGSSLVSSAKR